MPEFRENFNPGPLPEDKDIPQAKIDAAPEVQHADQIIARAEARLPSQKLELPKLTPEEREALRVFDVAEMPTLTHQALNDAQRVVSGIRKEALSHPADAELTKKYERAMQYFTRLRSKHELFVEGRVANTAEESLRKTTNEILTLKEKLEDLWHPPEPPERWPGTETHETSAEEAAEGGYEATLKEMTGEQTAPPLREQEEAEDTTDPNEYMAAVAATTNRIHQLYSATPATTEHHDQIISRAEGARAQAHNIIVGLQHFHDLPNLSSERKELEDQYARTKLRNLLAAVEHFEQTFE